MEWKKHKNCAREDIDTNKQLQPVSFKATKTQSIHLTACQFTQI